MDKTDRLRDYGLAFLLYEHGLGICGYELIRELFIFIKLILNSYLIEINVYITWIFVPCREVFETNILLLHTITLQIIQKYTKNLNTEYKT